MEALIAGLNVLFQTLFAIGLVVLSIYALWELVMIIKSSKE